LGSYKNWNPVWIQVDDRETASGVCRQGLLSPSAAGATIATAVEQRYAPFCCVVSSELWQVRAHVASRARSNLARSPLLTTLLRQVPCVYAHNPLIRRSSSFPSLIVLEWLRLRPTLVFVWEHVVSPRLSCFRGDLGLSVMWIIAAGRSQWRCCCCWTEHLEPAFFNAVCRGSRPWWSRESSRLQVP